ncbi:hypothetical protein [Kitasatospora sp. GAS204B]|uniref:hypothetical protein n=1 Tax=unclassified Kitasatospora TaxID=2633591 RepID=UPI002475ED75|nr:hypothetical protein [Kitasatospora sp. GAS204B]MDH6119810.1 hypothetical protein [Kitasatospora sp. GAS204B]
MMKSIQRGLAAIGATGAIAAGLVLGMAGNASATTGDWGWGTPGGTIFQPGTTTFTGTYPSSALSISCFSSNGCQYDPTMVIVGTPLNGATLGPVGQTSSLVALQNNGTPIGPVGTCTITSSTQVVCSPTSTGSISDGQLLSMTGSATLTVPSNLPNGTPVYETSWRDDGGMTGNYDGNDSNIATVISPAGAPIIDPAVGAGTTAAAGVGVGGLALLRRRRASRG